MRQAVADLVDNSVSAEASLVQVKVHFEGATSWICIADNGRGMHEDELIEAFRYGSERDYEQAELGRFGFGLKTASTSQCRKVTVVSRRDVPGAPLLAYQLDVDHITKVNRWEIFPLSSHEIPEFAVSVLGEGSGTVVLWEDLDRVLEYQDPFGRWAEQQLLKVTDDIAEHLALVFHRFLAGEVKGKNLRITVNERNILPFDPFCRAESNTTFLEEENLEVHSPEGNGIVRIRPYILPSQDGFSSHNAWKGAAGPEGWNRQQGFYIYRADRVIQSGGWCRLRAVDEHTKLARVSVEFFRELDSAFGLNVAKASVTLPVELRTELKSRVSQWASLADAAYRKKGRPSPRVAVPSARGASSIAPSAKKPAPIDPPAVPLRDGSRISVVQTQVAVSSAPAAPTPAPTPTHTQSLRSALEQAADQIGEGRALVRIMESLRSTSPEVAHELGW
ncbi:MULTISPECIES: ATP-binding protein [unclassified Streptomyces]|uniref:ATP-binding protein n=1 Tax=Streptomyces TaxID=1883 RepID=UPI000D50895A|nr:MULTISPECIES: ATP-binding protein [unclassified Streptomyces]PVD11852.1 ATP-binding protein [Streptomyces sp. CS207]RSS05683.1 ATP-binding protein [Streptomyces sp. WAC04189]RSS90637.1 ATP-binding protein [Streptomyces sp. WAC02707]